MNKLKVMLVDDHAVVRMGFKLLLQACDDIAVVAEADSGEEACQLYAVAAPDVVVMNLAMAGIEATSHPKRAMQAGALGYLFKRSAPEALIDAIRATAQGLRYLDARIAQRIAMQD